MTVSNTGNRKSYTGDGISTVFSFPYKFLAASDLKVYVGGVLKTLTTDYTVGTPSDAGASVTFLTAPASSASIVILRDPDLLQQSKLPSNGPFPALTVEQMSDKSTLQIQRLFDLISRSLTLNDTDVMTGSTQLPSWVKWNLLGWGETSDAGLQNVDPTTLATIVAFGTSNALQAVGDGVTKVFTLPANPGALFNLDVSVGGIDQRNGIDFTWVGGTSLTFTAAPALGVSIQAKFKQALPQGYTDSAASTFTPAGAGAVQRNVQDKLREFVSVQDFGASPSASAAANSAAFAAAVAAAAIAGLGVLIPAGSYNLNSTWTISTTGMRVRAEGKVILNFTNAGNCVAVDGGASGLYIFDVHFGEAENPIWINGNAATTTALFWRAAHHGSAAIKAWNCVIGHRTQFAVCNDFYVTVSNSEAVSNVLVPTTGISCERRSAGEDTAANNWWNPVIEGIKTSTGQGIYLGYTNRNKFVGGTSEGNVVGVFVASTAVGDTIDGLYCEANSGAAHFDISGTLITLANCFSSTSAPAPTAWVRMRSGATDCRVIGGNHPSITVDAGAVRTQIIGNAHSTSPTVLDSGTATTVIQGSAAWKIPFGAFIGGATALSSYDELTWTPVISGGTTPGTPTYTTQSGTYQIIGKWIHFRLYVLTSSLGGAVGNFQISLPVASSGASATHSAIAIGRFDGVTFDAGYATLGAVVSPASSVMVLYESGSGVSSQPIPCSKFSAATLLMIEGKYMTA